MTARRSATPETVAQPTTSSTQEASTEPEVTYSASVSRRSESSSQDNFRNIVTGVAVEYANRLKKNIELSNSTGGNFVRLSEPSDVLKVMFYTTIHRTNDTYFRRVYEYKVDGSQNHAYSPSGELLTVHDQNGNAVAEFAEDSVYVLFALPYGNHSVELFRHIMDDYCEYYELLKNGKVQQFIKKLEKRSKAAKDKLFFDLFRAGLEKWLENVEDEIESAEENLRDTQKEIIEQMRELEDLNYKKIGMTHALNTISKKSIQKEYDSLRAISVTGEIEVKNDSIKIPVGHVDICYNGVTYDIGDFVVEIYVDGNYGGVRCFNTTRSVVKNDYRYNHPHVKKDGYVCLGNISENVAELISRMQYTPVVQIMIDFLHTLNPSGWYCTVEKWPVKEATNEQSGSSNTGSAG